MTSDQISKQISDLCNQGRCDGAVWDCENVSAFIREANFYKPHKYGEYKITPFCHKCCRTGQPKREEKSVIGHLPSISRDEVASIKNAFAASEKRRKEKIKELCKAKDIAIKREREEKEAQWWEDYKAYLQTDPWREKSRTVIDRDRVCQACLKSPATQAHHLTYSHVFSEPLFDLVGVCKACHEAITEMDRERRIG